MKIQSVSPSLARNAFPVGFLTVTDPQEITHNHTYYAADHRTIRLTPGRYVVSMICEGGYTIPMPYWLVYGIDCEELENCCYSSFAGNNFAVDRRVNTGPSVYTVQQYAYQIATVGAAFGKFEPLSNMPDPMGLSVQHVEWARAHTPTWEALATLRAALIAEANAMPDPVSA